jgi:hypothetical protein
MAKSPAAWHADSQAPFAKADQPTNFERWTVVNEPSGRALSLLNGSGTPAAVLARATMLKPPMRWNNDPTQPLTCTLQGDALAAFVAALEDWLLPKIPGAACEVKVNLKTNVWAESYMKIKLNQWTRHFDAQGTQLDAAEYHSGLEVWVLLALKPYCLGNAKGLSLRALSVQA